jgi:hypothetical protein
VAVARCAGLTQLPWLLVAVVLLVVGPGAVATLVPLGAFLPDVVQVGTAMMAPLPTPVLPGDAAPLVAVARGQPAGRLRCLPRDAHRQSVSLVRVVTLAAGSSSLSLAALLHGALPRFVISRNSRGQRFFGKGLKGERRTVSPPCLPL